MARNSLTFPDRRGRVQFIFRQHLQAVLRPEPVTLDPQVKYQQRVQELELAYTACPHYLQPDFLDNYAKKHTKKLIYRREKIMEDFYALHDDPEFIVYLKQYHAHLYLFAKWETICLALAEKLEAATWDDGTPINAPPKRKLTPEEWREREVRRQQIKIDDKIALAKARLESLMNVRQLHEEYDLEDLYAEGVEQELRADILVPEEKDTGSYHQA